MSPRPFRLRKISNPPVISGLKPYGNNWKSGESKNIFLHLEEYEALRLCDFEMLNHDQAAVFMAVSRPTLAKIYAKARKKIAEALVLGRQIIIEGGKIYFDSDWLSCSACGCFLTIRINRKRLRNVPYVGVPAYQIMTQNNEEPTKSLEGCNDVCFCPACGFEEPHPFGCPCKDEVCPVCGENMVRK